MVESPIDQVHLTSLVNLALDELHEMMEEAVDEEDKEEVNKEEADNFPSRNKALDSQLW